MRKHISNFINPPQKMLWMWFASIQQRQCPLNADCLYVGWWPESPVWTQAHYNQPNWIPWEQSRNKAHHCSLVRILNLAFAASSWVPTGPQCVRILCETVEARVIFLLLLIVITSLTLWCGNIFIHVLNWKFISLTKIRLLLADLQYI